MLGKIATDTRGFNDDQLDELQFGRDHGLDVSKYEDPEYSADRMEILNCCQMEGYGEEVLGLLLDKTVDDTAAWNLLHELLMGKSLEELVMEVDGNEFG